MNRRTTIILYIFLQCILHHGVAQNQQIKFNLVEGNNGEPIGQINAITQDTHGYMWFNGQGANCLYRYDGVNMVAFKPDNLNPGSRFGTVQETIYADSKGLIWVGFLEGGMEQYNPQTGIFKHFKHDSTDAGSLGAGMVSAILRDHLGRLWVGTANGLDRLDENTGKFIHYRSDPANSSTLSSDVVRTIYEDRKGVLWIGTGFEFSFAGYKSAVDGGLNRMDPNGKFTRFMHDPNDPKSLINNKVRAIFEDSRGTFWIGTSGDGLHTMDREKGTFERHTYNAERPQQLSRPPLKEKELIDPITFINEDAAGSIWIGTYISGINRYDTGTKKITHYESSNGYPDQSSWASFESRDCTLWLTSTDQGGFLFRVDPVINKIRNNSTGNLIKCIKEDSQGMLWASGFGTGLLQYDNNKKLLRQFRYTSPDSINLVDTDIASIFQNQPDTLWLCAGTGIILFDKKNEHFTWLRYKPSPGAPSGKFVDEGVNKMIQDHKGLKWISTANGLVQYNPRDQSIKRYLPHANDSGSINFKMITSVLEDSSGDIWAGSGDRAKVQSPVSTTVIEEGGINRLDNRTGRIVHYLPHTPILCLYQDSEENIWAGSIGKGLFRFNKQANHFDNFFDPLSELGKEAVIDIIEDDLKNLWVITKSSMVKLNADRTSYFVYGKKYDIRSNTLRLAGICKTKNGDILVGNNNGFYDFSPNDMVETNKPLLLNITGFFINNHPVFPGKKSVLVNSIEETDKIFLKYNENNFSFSFAALDYRAPEANKYYTLLENFDSVWRDAAGDKSANYINVPPGNYMFRVKSINIDGITAEKTIQIVINPPWWKTWWAYMLYALLLLSVILWTHKTLKQRTIRLERQKAQVKELEQAKEIERAYTELKSTQAQLIQSEKMASLGELTAGIAHEIQNPLNFVNNFSEVNKELIEEMQQEMDRGNLEDAKTISNDIKENEEKINHHGKRADGIVKGMLQHSQISTGVKEPTDINNLAEEYLRLAYHGFRAKDISFNITMTTDLDKNIGKINLVPQDIGRVLINFFNNAFYSINEKRKTMSEKYEPTISVCTKILDKKPGSYSIQIRVKDNGVGISQKIIDKIYQPFFTTKPTGQGPGLGLSLAYDIITKEHGGQLLVESKEGEGAEFIVELPIR